MRIEMKKINGVYRWFQKVKVYKSCLFVGACFNFILKVSYVLIKDLATKL